MSDIKAVYDFDNHRIGDCIGAAYCLDVHSQLTGGGWPIGIVNRGALDISKWFPQIAENCFAEKPSDWVGKEGFPIGNIWITVPTVKLMNGFRPQMKVANDDQHYDVALHCLLTADYNTGRNHTESQFDEIERWLKWHGKTVYRVPKQGDIDEILTEIGRAKCYIGGDTGFTHAFAAMHPMRPLIAIYADNWHDVVAFEDERRKMQCAHHWCSDPVSFCLYKRTMIDHKFDERQVKSLLEKILKLTVE